MHRHVCPEHLFPSMKCGFSYFSKESALCWPLLVMISQVIPAALRVHLAVTWLTVHRQLQILMGSLWNGAKLSSRSHREASLGHRGSFCLHPRHPFDPRYLWLEWIKWRILDLNRNDFWWFSNGIHSVFATLRDLLTYRHDFVKIVRILKNRCSQNLFRSIQVMFRSH